MSKVLAKACKAKATLRVVMSTLGFLMSFRWLLGLGLQRTSFLQATLFGNSQGMFVVKDKGTLVGTPLVMKLGGVSSGPSTGGTPCVGFVVNSLTAMGGRDRPPFNELRARVVSPQIFVRCQRLMARKIAELFGLNRGVRPFYTACCFDELSRGSVSCLLNASFKTAVSQRHNSIF